MFFGNGITSMCQWNWYYWNPSEGISGSKISTLSRVDMKEQIHVVKSTAKPN